MDELLDFLVNVSLIILILGIYAIYKFRKEKKTYWLIVLLVAITLFGISVCMAAEGYGNFYISLIIIMLSIAFFVVLFCFGFYKKMYINILALIMPMTNLLHSAYKKIKYEEIKSIDEQTNNLAFFSAIIENEYFKGISIGIISAVIAGLILEKIKERK